MWQRIERRKVSIEVPQCCCSGVIYRSFFCVKLEAGHLKRCCCDSMTRPWCWYWHVIKGLKIARFLAYSGAASHTGLRSSDSHSDWGVEKNNPHWTFVWRGVSSRTQPQSSSSFFFLFFSCLQSKPSFFTAPLMGSPLLFPAVCEGLPGNHGSCPVVRDFFFLFTGVTGEVGRLQGQHMGGML